MMYDREEKVSLLECLADAIKRGVFNPKKECSLCKDRKVCIEIIKIMEE